MTNEEVRRRMLVIRTSSFFRHSDFVIRTSSFFRHSCFVIRSLLSVFLLEFFVAAAESAEALLFELEFLAQHLLVLLALLGSQNSLDFFLGFFVEGGHFLLNALEAAAALGLLKQLLLLLDRLVDEVLDALALLGGDIQLFLDLGIQECA